MAGIEERYETLVRSYQDLEQRYEVLKRTGVAIETMEPARAELVKWACTEGARWLDPRGGNGAQDEMGRNLVAVAYYLALDANKITSTPKGEASDLYSRLFDTHKQPNQLMRRTKRA